jgi:hypothetical protein
MIAFEVSVKKPDKRETRQAFLERNDSTAAFNLVTSATVQ